MFILSSQIKRAVVSISSNIAEGNSRGTKKAISLCEEINKLLNTLIIKLKENTSARAEGTTL